MVLGYRSDKQHGRYLWRCIHTAGAGYSVGGLLRWLARRTSWRIELAISSLKPLIAQQVEKARE